MFKKADIFVILIIFCVCVFAAALLFTNGGNSVRITVEGEIYATYNLRNNATHKIKTEKGSNTLVIENGVAYLKNSDCHDKTCENMGKIESLGESIVCLPHGLVVEVVE